MGFGGGAADFGGGGAGAAARRGLRRRRCSSGHGARLEHGKHLAARDDGAVGGHDLLQHAVGRGRHFEHDFVGLEVDEILFAPHAVTGLLVPGHQRRVRDGFG